MYHNLVGTHHTRKIFSLLYSSAMAFHFPWEICFYLLSFELFNCEHGYTIHLGLVIKIYSLHIGNGTQVHKKLDFGWLCSLVCSFY